MKIIFEILLAGAVASLAATACGDMDSIHEQYSGRPEKIYIGRVDSLKAHGGLNRTRHLSSNLFSRTRRPMQKPIRHLPHGTPNFRKPRAYG